MGKLGVDVGDEFPAEEIRRDGNGVVHHHHYYYRRRPFRLARLVLVVLLIGMVVRAFDYAWGPWRDFGHHRWMPLASFGGLIVAILVVSAALWVLGSRYPEDRR